MGYILKRVCPTLFYRFQSNRKPLQTTSKSLPNITYQCIKKPQKRA
nr:MAG TPA: hypothetical protein [Crassvirales sp.]